MRVSLLTHHSWGQLLASGEKARGVEDRDRAFRVRNLPLSDQLEGVGESHRLDRHEFVSFMGCVPALEPGGHEQMNPLVGEAGRRIDRYQKVDLGCGTPRLFA